MNDRILVEALAAVIIAGIALRFWKKLVLLVLLAVVALAFFGLLVLLQAGADFPVPPA